MSCVSSRYQELPFCRHRENLDSLNRGNYIELINLIAEYDNLLAEHLSSSTIFSGMSSNIQNDIIQCVCNVLLGTIRKEIQAAPFIAILLDEASDVSNKSQLSTVIRYVSPSGDIEERFLGYTDVSKDRSAVHLATHVMTVVNDLNCSKKIVAQAYDGAAVFSGMLGGTQALVRQSLSIA